jgi:glyoxylase-like metal-dependent hydrolase (beta-lactamase superfamily II)
MRLTKHVYLVGSGDSGFRLSADADCNVYLIASATGELGLIDSGSGLATDIILKQIIAEGFDPSKIKIIFCTHAHPDHAGGIYELRKLLGCIVALPDAEATGFEAHDEAALGLIEARRAGIYGPEYSFRTCHVDYRVQHKDEFTIGELRITAIHVPSHSVGSTCYLLQEGQQGRKSLFSGDVIFADGRLGLLNCQGSSLENYRKYLSRLRGLGIDALFPGHYRFVLNNGQKDIDKACQILETSLFIPPTVKDCC